MESKKNNSKNIFLWVLSIFFILSFFVYIGENCLPSIAILIAGILLIPPFNKRIKEKLEEEKKIKNYSLFKNIVVVILVIFFILGLESGNQNYTKINKEQIKLPQTGQEEKVKETNGTYTGERVNGKKQGNAKFEWNDGSVYEGEFSEDKINGNGKLTIAGKGTYEGNFVNGKMNGQGTFTFTNGDIYQGSWEDDKMSGKGIYKFANGEIYEGEFKNNQFNGQGTYTINQKKYSGTWENNEYKNK